MDIRTYTRERGPRKAAATYRKLVTIVRKLAKSCERVCARKRGAISQTCNHNQRCERVQPFLSLCVEVLQKARRMREYEGVWVEGSMQASVGCIIEDDGG